MKATQIQAAAAETVAATTAAKGMIIALEICHFEQEARKQIKFKKLYKL